MLFGRSEMYLEVVLVIAAVAGAGISGVVGTRGRCVPCARLEDSLYGISDGSGWFFSANATDGW